MPRSAIMPRIIDDVLGSFGFGTRRSVGVALSGGGARGFAHIGVFQALEKFELRPDVLAGVSAGSVAATLYGSGLTPLEIIECFSEYVRFGDYAEWTVPRAGFFRLNKFAKILESWLPVKNLEECKIPIVVCATDIERGRSVGWAKGEIIPRVIASCSIPVIFHPVKINGVQYVDGGVLRNLPAWAIRKVCRTLIGSNCSPLKRGYQYHDSIIDTTLRTFHLMMKANALQDLSLCDIVVQSAGLADYKTFDVASMKKIVTSGYDAACRVLEKTRL